MEPKSGYNNQMGKDRGRYNLPPLKNFLPEIKHKFSKTGFSQFPMILHYNNKQLDPIPVISSLIKRHFTRYISTCIINMQFPFNFNSFQYYIQFHDRTLIQQYIQHIIVTLNFHIEASFKILSLNQNILNVFQLKTYIKLLSSTILQNLNTQLQINKHVDRKSVV